MSNPTGKGGFQERKHQINRKGRPRNFDALRELAQQIAHEPVTAGDRRFTVVEAILRSWAQSKNPQLQRAFIEYAYGRVPERQEVTGAEGDMLKVIVEYVSNGSASE